MGLAVLLSVLRSPVAVLNRYSMHRERTEIENAHSRQKKDMNDMMTAMEQGFQDAENEARHEFESVREEIKNRNSEEYNVLKIQLNGTIEDLERHFEHAHQVLHLLVYLSQCLPISLYLSLSLTHT